jgi:hypothetical protein
LFSGNLHIYNSTQADEGTYLCSASNGVGSVQVKAMELNIEGQSNPFLERE